MSVTSNFGANPCFLRSLRMSRNALTAMFPGNPPRFIERTAMGYHDVAKIRADLARAGFMESTVDTRALPCYADSARNVAFGLVQGTPVGAEVTETVGGLPRKRWVWFFEEAGRQTARRHPDNAAVALP